MTRIYSLNVKGLGFSSLVATLGGRKTPIYSLIVNGFSEAACDVASEGSVASSLILFGGRKALKYSPQVSLLPCYSLTYLVYYVVFYLKSQISKIACLAF